MIPQHRLVTAQLEGIDHICSTTIEYFADLSATDIVQIPLEVMECIINARREIERAKNIFKESRGQWTGSRARTGVNTTGDDC